MMKKTKCDGCGSGDYGKDYIYSVCVTCREEVCGWCSYDVVRENGQLCIRCGYGVSTPEEVEEIAKKMKCDPHTYTYTPTAKPTEKPKTKKVVLKIVKKIGWYDKAVSRKQKETEDYHAGRIKTCEIDLRCDCCRVDLGEYPCGQNILSLCYDCRWIVRTNSEVEELRRTEKLA
jgi:hypothetical protein